MRTEIDYGQLFYEKKTNKTYVWYPRDMSLQLILVLNNK